MKFKEEDIEVLKAMVEEANELLKNLEEKVVTLEQSPSKEIVNDIFRVFHSLKGIAGFANVKSIVDVSHAIESVLKKIRDESLPIKPDLIDLLLDGTDFCRVVVNKIAMVITAHSGGEIQVEIENLGEIELIERANEYLKLRSEESTPNEKTKGVLPKGFEVEAFSDFIIELRENLDAAESNMLDFEQTSDWSLLNIVMRSMHNIKGGARLLLSIPGETPTTPEIRYLEKISHVLEDHLQGAMQRKSDLNFNYVLSGIDLIRKLAHNLENQIHLSKQEMSTIEDFLSAFSLNQEQQVREETTENFATREAFFNIASQLVEYAKFLVENQCADNSELNRIAEPLKAGLLMIGCSEKTDLVDRIIHAAGSGNFEELKLLSEEFLSWLKQEDGVAKSALQMVSKALEVEKTTSQTIRVNKSKLDALVNLVGELITAKNSLKYLVSEISLNPSRAQIELKNLSLKFERLSYDFQSSVMSLRMVPVEELFKRYSRTVRDLARSLNKTVVLRTEGEDVEIDKSVLELLSDPITHLVRNAVDHGIEPPEERKRLGKPEQGTIVLRAYYKGNSVTVEVEDDGRGIDVNKVKLKALDRGLISEEQVMNMSDDEVLQLIFLPGFSTAEKITDISGRGVGMDVVKTNVEKIGGKTFVKTQLGKGTTVAMSIPLSLMAIKGLLVRVGNERFIVPAELVRETLKLPRKAIYSYKGLLFAKIRGQIVPVRFLQKEIMADSLDFSQKQFDFDLIPLLVVADENKMLALIVDSFVEKGDYLVKSMPKTVSSTRLITGATIMGDGSIVLIIDPTILMKGVS